MRRRSEEPKGPSPAMAPPETGAPGEGEATFSLVVSDFQGRERRGSVVVARQWHPALDDIGQEDFRLVILSQPWPGPVAPEKAVAVCAPSRPLGGLRRIKEAGIAYAVEGEAALPLGRQDMEALGRGRLLAPVELGVRPQDIFPPGGEKARLDLLAQDLLLQLASSPYRAAARLALSAPSDPPVAITARETQQRLTALLAAAAAALPKSGEGWPELREAIQRLTSLARANSSEERLKVARRLYPAAAGLAEDIYALRALAEHPAETLGLAAMHRYLQEATLPEWEVDLALDRTIAMEQMSYALLVTEPHRFPSARASFAHFQSRYRSVYAEHLRRYWAAAARLQAQLLEAGPHVLALSRLNSLTELGPPVGEGAIAAYQDLLDKTAGCHLTTQAEEVLRENALCPGCRIALGAEPPIAAAADVLNRIERAIGKQMARLSSTAVQQVLSRSSDPRVEQFLKVVQASQLSSLAEVLDDELLGFLRRFLVEARIEALLQPLLDGLQKGPLPGDAEAEQASRDVSRVLSQAARAARRQLPPPPLALRAKGTENKEKTQG